MLYAQRRQHAAGAKVAEILLHRVADAALELRERERLGALAEALDVDEEEAVARRVRHRGNLHGFELADEVTRERTLAQ